MLLLNGDCIEQMKIIPAASVDMIFTDLPYGTTARNIWDKKIPLEPLWEQVLRVIKPNGVIALWSQMPFSVELIMSQPKLFRYEWIIEKTTATGFLNANKMPMKAHESILIFYKTLPTYNPQMTHNHLRKIITAEHKRNSKKSTDYDEHKLTSYDSTDRYPRDVLKFKWDKQKSRLHPTQKPVEACEYFIKTYTNTGDLILDCCMGSGTIGVAAIKNKRKFIGIEIDESYYAIAKERIAEYGRFSI